MSKMKLLFLLNALPAFTALSTPGAASKALWTSEWSSLTAAGADYQTSSGVIAGMAFTAGSQTQDFSTGGDFDQTEEALSLYAAYKAGPLWGTVATYGLLQDDISRQVTLGRFINQNNADAT
jgi:hypothetical protein